MNPAQSDSKLAEENMNLKVLVQKLETENYYLKEQTFTFDFPISQPGLYGVAKANITSSASEKSATPSPASQTIDSISSKSSMSPASASASTFLKGNNVTNPPTHDQLPWSPPPSVGDSVPNSPLDLDRLTPERDAATQVSHADSAGIVPKFRNISPRDIASLSSFSDAAAGKTISLNRILDGELQQPIQHEDSFATHFSQTSLPPGTSLFGQLGQSNTFSMGSSTSPMSTLVGFSEHTPSPTLNDLVNTPLFSANAVYQFTTTPSDLTVPALMFDPTHALFTDFRDSSNDFLAGFEDPVKVSTFPDDPIAMDELFNDQLLNYTTTLTNMTAAPVLDESRESLGQDHVTTATPASAAGENQMLTLLPLSEDEKAIPCAEAWEHLAKHPKFDDAEIDDLCLDLKAKAKCSGHGPVISLTDMDKLMNKLDQE